jgi:hypothetical protein
MLLDPDPNFQLWILIQEGQLIADPDPENRLIPYGTYFFSLQVSEDLKTRMMKMEAELIRVSLSNLYPVFRIRFCASRIRIHEYEGTDPDPGLSIIQQNNSK